MLRWIALGLVIASCGKGGVELVIEPDTEHVTKVQLFVGVGDPDTDPIMPAMRSAPFPSSAAWVRDKYNELDEREIASGENAVFQFQGSEPLGVVIAVGYTDGRPVSAVSKRGIEVPSDFVARYELALEPIATPNTTHPLTLDIWQPQPGTPMEGKTCVALFDKRDNSADAVVTEDDPDCDGWPTDDPKECQPSYYMSFKRPKLEDVACLVTERVLLDDGNVSDGCVLGGPPCRDGFGQESSCTAPSVYCVPKSVCNRCAATSNTYDCARDITPLAAQFPTRLHCPLFFDDNGQLCASKFKAVMNPPPDIAGRHCRTGSDHPALITSAGTGWGTNVELTNGSAKLKVEVKNLEPNCNFEIAVSGEIDSRQVLAGLVAGKLDNGRGIAIPIVFEADPTLFKGCDNQVACQATWGWDFSELVDQCINTPVFPP